MGEPEPELLVCPRCGAALAWLRTEDVGDPLVYKSGDERGRLWCYQCEEAFPMAAL